MTFIDRAELCLAPLLGSAVATDHGAMLGTSKLTGWMKMCGVALVSLRVEPIVKLT